jgi:hypothetical protein
MPRRRNFPVRTHMEPSSKVKSPLQNRFEAKSARFHPGPNFPIDEPYFSDLKRPELMVYYVLCVWQDRDTGDVRRSKCELELSEKTGYHVRSVRRAMRTLRAIRWITTRQQGRLRIHHVEEQCDPTVWANPSPLRRKRNRGRIMSRNGINDMGQLEAQRLDR